jgi:WD40 repeat protein
VTDLGLVVGFLMPKLDTSKAKPIFQYYNPSERRKESPTFSYVSLMRTARNLARAVRSVHLRGYVIGDVNESNVLVAEDAIVTLVDTDSFQVNDGTTVYRCTVGKPEYTPPELQGVSFRDVDRSVEHDLFGLGVLIYQLLMEGTHPFGGVFTGQGEAPELQDRIKAGHFPHGRRGIPYKPMPLAPSFQMLPVALQELFLLCFEVGHGNPAARPTAEVWSKALGEAEDGLVRCGVNGQHHYSDHLGVCPWCERAVKLGGRDPFPALGAIRSGQHLKPAAIVKAVGKPILNTNPKPPTSINTNPISHRSASTSSANNSNSQSTNTSSSVTTTPQTKILPNPNPTHNKPFFSSNISGTQQSQIASLQSRTITNATKSGTNVSHWKKLDIVVIGFIFGVIVLIWQMTRLVNSPTVISSSSSSTSSKETIKEIQTFKGHTSYVSSVAFSPDGKTIATGSWDNTVKLWNLYGKELQTFTGYTDSVKSVAFSPDGKMIATGSEDNTAKLWNLDGKELQTFKGHSHWVLSVAFSPDGKTIATGSYDTTAKLWNLDGKELQTFTGHTAEVRSVAFSSDGKIIATGSMDNTVKLWNLDGKELQTFTEPDFVYSIAFSPDGKMIATGSRDKTAKLWNLDGKRLQTLTGHTDLVLSVVFSPDGKMIATGSNDKTVKLWNLNGKELQTFTGHTDSVKSVAFSLDGKMIATGSSDKTIKIWEVK